MASIFINPKTDFAFKKIFGSAQSHGILVSFLNGILYAGESIIEDREILNPYQAPRIRGVKDTYLDVKAKLVGGQTVIIEMQVLNVEGFEKRILYNAAKAYSIQLSQGDQYKLLNPVIALTITDFTMFSEFEAVISRFVLKEKDYLVDYPSCDLELVFVDVGGD
jgi:predicted transposase/invertase (TIGR01784 family)